MIMWAEKLEIDNLSWETGKVNMIKVDIIVESRYKCGSWLDYDDI